MTAPAEELDPDESFVLHRIGTWLERVLASGLTLNAETLEFMTWLLGPDIDVLGDHMAEEAEEQDRLDLVEEVAECRADATEYPRTVLRYLARMPQKAGTDLVRVLNRLLTKRVRQLVPRRPARIEKSAGAVQSAFELTAVERELFLFLFIIKSWTQAEEYFEGHLGCVSLPGRKYLAALLGTTTAAVEEMTHGTLVKAGLVEVEWGQLSIRQTYQAILRDPVREMVPDGLYRALPKESLPLDAHGVSAEATAHALTLFRSAASSPVHILLYGVPGAGKTTYGRRLAHESGLPSVEVPPNENDRHGVRRTGLTAAQLLKNDGKGVVILIDEADALLNTASSWFSSGNRQDKGWLNDVLEQPGARVIWIVNETSDIEPSVLRRFAFSIHFKPFTKRQRAELWERILRRRKLKRFFGPAEIEALVRDHDVSAGVIDLAVRKAAETGARRKDDVQKAVKLALEAHETLQRDGRPSAASKEAVDADYSLDGLNIQGDVEALLLRLRACDRQLRDRNRRRRRGMNVLLYGPPGTGKSELARHIARHLDRELIVKRTSDIMSCWVGSTEKAIAAAFAEAEREDAVLVLDEIDTLLFDRREARHSWEVSFTNELLTQMERFQGILVCTTNRLDGLDAASIRRFGDKLGFDFLTPDGNEVFYRKMLEAVARRPMDEASRRRLLRIACLAPGDFKIVRDRWAFSDERPDHATLLDELEAEARLKEARRGEQRVGF